MLNTRVLHDLGPTLFTSHHVYNARGWTRVVACEARGWFGEFQFLLWGLGFKNLCRNHFWTSKKESLVAGVSKMNQCIPSLSLTAFSQNTDMFNNTGMYNRFLADGSRDNKNLSALLAFWNLYYLDNYVRKKFTKKTRAAYKSEHSNLI